MTGLSRSTTSRTVSASRLLLLGGGFMLALGAFAGVLREPLLAAAIGPTLYVLLVHPDAEVSQIKNAVIGHGAAVGAGLIALAVMGLWRAPPALGAEGVPFRRTAAAALALALTVTALELFDAHHAPAAATTLLVASGISRPGPGLTGLVIGLLAVIAVAPVIAQFPARNATRRRHHASRQPQRGAST